MRQYFQELSENFHNGVREFSQHPIRYTARAVGEAVKDYWDLGVAVTGGYLFAHEGMLEGLGIFLVGSLAGYGQGNEIEGQGRGARNVLAGMTGMLVGSGHHPSMELGALTALASAYMDRHRRRENSRSKNSQTETPITHLENIVD